MFIMLPCSQRALILVLEHGGNFGVRLPPGCSRHGVSVHCLCVQMLSFYATRWPVLPKCMQLTRLTLVSWHAASMLCYHCWMFSLSDALSMQSYPSKSMGTLSVQSGRATQLICLVSNRSVSTWNRRYIMANTLKMLTSWYCQMFILLECSFY